MEIRDLASKSFVRLSPISYERTTPSGDPFDDNWLVIRGHILYRGEEWTFEQPLLLVDEAGEFGPWLRASAAGNSSVLTANTFGHTEPDTQSIECAIALGLVVFSEDRLTVRVFLCQEAAAESAKPAYPFDFYVDITTTPDELVHAAVTWEEELSRFPSR